MKPEPLKGSPLPFANQPGSGLQLGARAYRRRSALFELPGKLAQLALPLRAQAAESEFLHPVRDGSHEQRTAEMRRRRGFVENAPLPTKLAKIELGEARERLPASPCIVGARAPCSSTPGAR